MAMAGKTFDRTLEDLGNMIHLEHVNVRVPDQQLATQFYVVALGLTRDPYLMVGLENMWINVGHSQFHLPTAAAQVLRGFTGLVIPDFDELPARLATAAERLKGTKFSYSRRGELRGRHLPVGEPVPAASAAGEVPAADARHAVRRVPGAPGHGRRYRALLQGDHRRAVVRRQQRLGGGRGRRVGLSQKLIFRETNEPLDPYDGHHIAVYIADFSGPHKKMLERGLVSEESNPYQYRFVDIVDPDNGKVLFEIEHEVRCVTHPMYRRPLMNRNAAQRQPTYVSGLDARSF